MQLGEDVFLDIRDLNLALENRWKYCFYGKIDSSDPRETQTAVRAMGVIMRDTVGIVISEYSPQIISLGNILFTISSEHRHVRDDVKELALNGILEEMMQDLLYSFSIEKDTSMTFNSVDPNVEQLNDIGCRWCGTFFLTPTERRAHYFHHCETIHRAKFQQTYCDAVFLESIEMVRFSIKNAIQNASSNASFVKPRGIPMTPLTFESVFGIDTYSPATDTYYLQVFSRKDLITILRKPSCLFFRSSRKCSFVKFHGQTSGHFKLRRLFGEDDGGYIFTFSLPLSHR